MYFGSCLSGLAHADLFDELSLCGNLDKARRYRSSYLQLLKDWGVVAVGGVSIYSERIAKLTLITTA
jgi:hypothetical protein